MSLLSLMGLEGTVMVTAEIVLINTVLKVTKIDTVSSSLTFLLLINTVLYFFL